MKIGMVSVFVDDPIQAHKFYTEVLGFQSRMFMPEMYLAIVQSPEEPHSTGLLLEPTDDKIARPYKTAIREAGLPCIVFAVDDIQKEYDRLKAAGVEFRQAPTKNEVGWEAVFDDTCGNYIQIFQMG